MIQPRNWAAAGLAALISMAACEAAPSNEGAGSLQDPLTGSAVSAGGETLPYHRSSDFKFPPIRGDDGLMTGPLSMDELMAFGGAGSSPFWHPEGDAITFGYGGGLWSMDPQGSSLHRLEVELGGSGFFLTPQYPDWSPDGRWISYISSKSGTPELWVWDAEAEEDRQLTDLGFEELNAYSWAPNGERIAFSANRHGTFDVWTVEVPEGRVRRVTEHPDYEVFPTWTPDSQELVFVRLDEQWVDQEVIRIEADGSNPRLVVRNTDFFDYGSGRTFGFPLVSPQGDALVFRSHRSGWINYWQVPLEGEAAAEPVQIAIQEADQSHIQWSPDGSSLAFTSNKNGTHDLRVVAAGGGEARVLVDPADPEGPFGGMGMVSAPRWSPNGQEIVYTVETPTHPSQVEVVSVESGERRPLTRSLEEPLPGSPALDRPLADVARQLAVPEKVFYPSTHGLTIPAYLYRPMDAEDGDPLPGLLWIHGGPTSQFHDSFQSHVQFFVQEGYVVLMPNIRGSSGYGKEFEELNEECWGHCDLEDVVAGVEFLQTLPYVDPDRMGIHGASYGGIMSMAAAAFAPGVFQASVPHGGFGDWIEFYHGHNELRHIKLLEYELGPFDENEEIWRRSSAIYAVEDITTPIFLIHGDGNYPVYSQTYDFARALQRHHKPFRYNVYYGENYYVSSEANRRQMLVDMLKFLNQQLKDTAMIR